MSIHCFIHREALACKTLPYQLKSVFKSIVKIVNIVKSSALCTRLFKKLCEDMDAEFDRLLFYTQVR